MSADLEKPPNGPDQAPCVDAKASAREAPLTSLTRRHATLGLAALAAAPTLSACGGGGGGGGGSATEAPAPAPAPAPPPTSSAFANGAVTSVADAAFSFLTDTASRDQEITTFLTAGRVYLRVTADGKCLWFERSGTDLHIGIGSGLSNASYYPAVGQRLWAGPMPAPPPSGGSAPALTYGVQGFDIYAKVNGVEFIRFKSHHHVLAGKIGIKMQNGYSCAAISGTHFVDKALFSDIATKTYDARDFGWRRIATTGSMAAGSTTLTLPADAGFEVGDFVIVEIGNEAGAGQRGTKGVGGTWPALSYANGTAMSVDAGQPANTYAWREDTGLVYRFVNSAWTLVPNDSFGSAQYYIQKAVPKSLKAQIIAIAGGGKSLTLDAPSSVGTANANVYLDCAWVINKLTFINWGSVDLRPFKPQMNIVLPEGDFPCSGSLWVNDYNGSSNGNSLNGQGKDRTILRSPRGVTPVMIESRNATDIVIRDLQIVGNMGDSGLGLNWRQTPLPWGLNTQGMQTHSDIWCVATGCTETSVPQGYAYSMGGVFVVGCTASEVRNMKSVNSFQHAVGTSFCTNVWVRNCDCVMTEVPKIYLSWQFQQSDSTGGGFVDCTLEAAATVAGWEAFKSSGTAFTRCTSVNGVMATNGSEAWSITDCIIRTTALCESISMTTANPLININNNIGVAAGLVDGGGTISNITITQTGYNDADNNNAHGIIVNAAMPAITITGGTITIPDYVSGGSSGAMGVNSTGPGTVVTGLTVIGKARHEVTGSGYRNIQLTGGSGSSATGCTANEIYVNP